MSEADPEREKLGRLAKRLLASHEEERKRIARALHDDVGQQVASLSILTGTLKRHLHPGDTENRQQADRIREKLIALSESMGRLSMGLYPTVLEHAGIGVSLHQLCDSFATSSGIRVSYESDGEFKDVPFALGLGLYRIAQEVLGSLVRDRSGSQASVCLARSGERIELAVEDSGQGLFAALCDADDGLGFCALQQRASSIQGEICLENSPGSRSRLTIRVSC